MSLGGTLARVLLKPPGLGLEPAMFGTCLVKSLSRQFVAPAVLHCQLEEIATYPGGVLLTCQESQQGRQQAQSQSQAQPVPAGQPKTAVIASNCALGHAAGLGGHPCPAQAVDGIGVAVTPLKLAVCAIVEDVESRVLLTRRPDHMRLFPGAWVLPGGGVDEGETLAAAASRELYEEVGISLSADEISAAAVVGLWESCYPVSPADGPLSGHHLVIYMRFRLALSCEQYRLEPHAPEVSSCAWLTTHELRRVLASYVGCGVGAGAGAGGGQQQRARETDGVQGGDGSPGTNSGGGETGAPAAADASGESGGGAVGGAAAAAAVRAEAPGARAALLETMMGIYGKHGRKLGIAEGHFFALAHHCQAAPPGEILD